MYQNWLAQLFNPHILENSPATVSPNQRDFSGTHVSS